MSNITTSLPNDLSLNQLEDLSFNIPPQPILYNPLIYPIMNSDNKDVYNNILLIDSRVNDYNKIIQASNSNTLPIVYSITASKSELLTLLQNNFTNISRIAIIFQSSSENTYFLDMKPFYIVNETIPYSENTQFIIDIIKQFNIKNVDYLACSTLNDQNWVNYYNIIMNDTGVIIGASNDETGNIQYGGDWIMESNQNDIEFIYFTHIIEYYSYLLDTLITIPYTGYSLTYNLVTDSTVVSVYSITTTQTELSIIIPSSIIYNSTTYNVTSIGVSAFINCTQLVSVTIPDTVTTIGKNAFNGCNNITNVTLSNNLLSIGDYAFSYTTSNYNYNTTLITNLTQITFPNTLQSIGRYAFFASGLLSITIPESVTTIGDYAFYMSYKISRYYRSFWGPGVLQPYPTGLITFLHTSTLPNIGSYAFTSSVPSSWNQPPGRPEWSPCYVLINYACSNFSVLFTNIYSQSTGIIIYEVSPNLGSLMRYIYTDTQGMSYSMQMDGNGGDGSAYYKYAVITGYTGNAPIVRIPQSFRNTTLNSGGGNVDFHVTTIGNNVFENCTNLEKILIPCDIMFIGTDAFKGCSSLVDVTFGGTSPTLYGDISFNIQTQRFTRPTEDSTITQAFDNTNTSFSVYYNGNLYTSSSSFSTASGFPVDRLIEFNVTPENTDGIAYIITSSTTVRAHDLLYDNYVQFNQGEVTIPYVDIYPSDSRLYSYPSIGPYNSSAGTRNLTSIGDYAFYNMLRTPSRYTYLSLNIQGDYLTSIGKYAFSGPQSTLKYLRFVYTTANRNLPTVNPTAFQNNAFVLYRSDCTNTTTLTAAVSTPGRLGLTYSDPSNNSYFLFNDLKATLISKTTANPIPSNVTLAGNTYTVTSIGPSSCSSSTVNQIIPNSVTVISDNAFGESSNTAFTSITIPANVSIIGKQVFIRCTSLTSVNILSNKLTYIGSQAFWGCSKLPSISIPNNPNSDTIIDQGCFTNCSKLTSVTLGNSIKFISSGHFQSCLDLVSLTLPSTLTSIPQGFCNSCPKLTNVSIPDTVTSIENFAFYNCTSLNSIRLPSSLLIIGESAFYNCPIISINIPSKVVNVGPFAFHETNISIVYFLTLDMLPFSSNGSYLSKNLSSLIMYVYSTADKSRMLSPYPDYSSYFHIIYLYQDSQGIFYNCDGGYATITNYYGSGSSIIIPYNITVNNILFNVNVINSFAFYGGSFTNIIIPNSITTINSNPFQNCNNIRKITFLWKNNIYPTISNTIFLNTNNNITVCYRININWYALQQLNSALTDYSNQSSSYVYNIVLIYTDSNYIDYYLNSNNYSSILGYDLEVINISTIQSLTIPNTIQIQNNTIYTINSIEDYAFANATSLANIIFNTLIFPTLGLNVFINILNSCSVIYNATYDNANTISSTLIYYGLQFINFTINYTLDNVYYILTNSNMLASVYGYINSIIISVELPSIITLDSMNYSLVSIGASAFANSNITRIIIPETINSIGNQAFYNCTGLIDIIFLHKTDFPSFSNQVFFNIPANSSVTYEEILDNSILISLGFDPYYFKSIYTDYQNITYMLIHSNLQATLLRYSENVLSTIYIQTNISNKGVTYLITSIADYAFMDSTNLSKIYLLTTTKIPTLGINSFLNLSPDYLLYYYASVSNPLVVKNPFDVTTYIYLAGLNPSHIRSILPDGTITCFKQGTKILTDKGYIPVENLRKGDLVKTIKNGYKPIFMIGKKEIKHIGSKERIKDQLYKCSKNKYPELFEDLIITGCHSILIDKFKEGERDKTLKFFNDIFVSESKYRLPACLDERARVYEIDGLYTIYHFALEHENYYKNYGVNANGLLVESCSKRYITEYSNMNIIE